MRARNGSFVCLYVVLGLLATCTSARASVKPGRIDGERHSPQGPSLQGTALPVATPGWLRGPRFVASLADGTAIEITHFGGDEMKAFVRDQYGAQVEARNLSPKDLIGMHWNEVRCESTGEGMCTELAFRIVSVVFDGSSSTMAQAEIHGNTWLYRVEYATRTDAGFGDWIPACASSADMEMGLFVDGTWESDGSWHSDGYTFSCTRGVIAKCAREWGYQPWLSRESVNHGQIDLQPLHLACTRAARAEYCGDGVSYTQDGVVIDLFDIYGFNQPEPDLAFVEESTWDEHGAITVHHARIPGLSPGQCRSSASDREPSNTAPRSPVIYVWSAP